MRASFNFKVAVDVGNEQRISATEKQLNMMRNGENLIADRADRTQHEDSSDKQSNHR